LKSFKNIKIFIVAESIDAEDSSGTKGRIALIQNLKIIGYDIKVFHYSRKHIKLDGIDCIAIKENRRSVLFFLSRLERYFRNYLKIPLNKPLEKIFGFSFTLLNDRESILSGLKEHRQSAPDLIFTFSKGGSFRPHHALLKIPEWHSKWVAYMHDPYPMHMYPKPFPWKEPGFQQKENFIRLISENAAHPVFPSLLLKEWMGQFFPGFLINGEVIPHQINENSNLITTGEFPDFFSIEKFNLLHAGNLLQARQPQGIVEAFDLFLKKFPDAQELSQLTFIGPAAHHSSYLKQKSTNLPGLVMVDENRKFEEVNLLQENASVNIILEAKSDISPFLPGKFAHCVKADKPILHLGPKHSETKRLLGDNYPYWAEIDDVPTIAGILGVLFQQWKKEKDMKLNRPDLIEYLSIQNLQTVMEKILRR